MIIKRQTSATQLRQELEQFEAEFGVPSARMAEAFTVEGELRESAALARWALVYSAYQQLSGAPVPA